MIDGIKTKFIDIPNQSLLDWRLSVSERNSDYTESKKIKYKGLNFNRKDGKFFIEGSLHTFFNNGLHNYNDFTYTDLVNTVKQLKTLFGINPEKVLLSNVEFGVNIILPYPPEKIINSLVIHKGEAFNKIPYSITKGTGAGVEVIHKNYIIKIYDKGAQNDLEQFILRIEIKAIKMAFFQYYRIPIQTLNDLINIANLKALDVILVNMINECLIVDPAILVQENIIESDKLILANGSNANYWKQLLPNSKQYPKENKDPEYKRHRKKYYKEYERFENVLNKYNSDSKKQIIKLTGDKLTDLKNHAEIIIEGDKLTDPKQAKGTNSPLVYNVNLYQDKIKICPVTKLEIRNQKECSKFLSIQGIKFYYKNDSKTFQLLEKRLSKKWQLETIETKIKEIAHSIRNEYFNPKNDPRNNTKNAIFRVLKHPTLFNNIQLIDERKKRIAGLM
jgi:hypothetical protein